MSNTKQLRSLVITVFLSIALIAGFIPASGAWPGANEGSVAYAGTPEEDWPGYEFWEDCEWDGYDDYTGVAVPWYGFDGKDKGDVPPDGWDGITRTWEDYYGTGDTGSGGGTGGNGSGNDTGTGGTGNGTGSGDGSGGAGTGTGTGVGSSSGDGTGGGTTTVQTPPGDANTVQAPSSGNEPVSQTGQDKNDTSIRIFSKTPSPKITGTAKVGKTLKAKTGAWSPKPKLTYRWYADGKAISGATKASYKLKKAQKGKRITVKITASKAGYNTVTKTSGKTAKVK
jgi:hypothetical protein